jgi:hypothetical protein
MAVASAKFEAGQVLLPERAPWLADLEAELFVFPGSRQDDQCDSISQALLDKNTSFMTGLHPKNGIPFSRNSEFLNGVGKRDGRSRHSGSTS